MMSNQTITFVSPIFKDRQYICGWAERLEAELSIKIKQVSHVSELFPLLSDPSYNTDIIAIDLDRLINRKDGLDIFDIIHTLSTLIKCTVHRTSGGKPVKRETKISVLVNDCTDPKLIRQIMLLPDVFLGMLMSGTWSYNLVKENIIRNLNGDYSPSKQILDLIKSNKCKAIKKSTINLTPRECQILTLIQERGVSNKTIARMLDISESTVKLHIGKVLKKYGCKNRTQLALFSK
jgi:DNA-binding NarL/FixJ family response regulator